MAVLGALAARVQSNGGLEALAAWMVDVCQGMVGSRVEAFVQREGAREWAEKVWSGEVRWCDLPQALFPTEDLQRLLREIEQEIEALALFHRCPWRVSLTIPGLPTVATDSGAGDLAERRATHLLAVLLSQACQAVWSDTLATWGSLGCMGKKMGLGEAVTNHFYLMPQREREGFLQSISKMIAGYQLNCQRYLQREICRQIADQIWLLCDAQRFDSATQLGIA
ncbi:hypothetical protein [Desulfothermobacter acidiphilus]|uniref:hypothetical protein n=1 Tax=Desulfothermobacter acidiphilus TaxID=1938353 RepID=UPI003F898316